MQKVERSNFMVIAYLVVLIQYYW